MKVREKQTVMWLSILAECKWAASTELRSQVVLLQFLSYAEAACVNNTSRIHKLVEAFELHSFFF
jgi:hypothetical protein